MLVRKRLGRVCLGGAGEGHRAPGVARLAAREGVRVRARLPHPAVVAADAALGAVVVVVGHDPLVVVAVVYVVVVVDITWSWGVVHHSIAVVHHHSETHSYTQYCHVTWPDLPGAGGRLLAGRVGHLPLHRLGPVDVTHQVGGARGRGRGLLLKDIEELHV